MNSLWYSKWSLVWDSCEFFLRYFKLSIVLSSKDTCPNLLVLLLLLLFASNGRLLLDLVLVSVEDTSLILLDLISELKDLLKAF